MHNPMNPPQQIMILFYESALSQKVKATMVYYLKVNFLFYCKAQRELPWNFLNCLKQLQGLNSCLILIALHYKFQSNLSLAQHKRKDPMVIPDTLEYLYPQRT